MVRPSPAPPHWLHAPAGRTLLVLLQLIALLAGARTASANEADRADEPTRDPAAEEAPASAPVGMCGVHAQSIVAPPPVYPASDALATACRTARTEARQGVPVPPLDPPGSLQPDLRSAAVLLGGSPLPRRSATASPFESPRASGGQEHPWKHERPPRS